MSLISSDIYANFPSGTFNRIDVNKNAVVHGEDAVMVIAFLADGRTVEGTFTKDQKAGFGGVDFETKKDVAGLMTAKILSVLNGTHDA